MDNKKLIGTVLGVIAFVALIAGATFAWLTATVTVTNGAYGGKTKNFVIEYAGSPKVTSPVMLSLANAVKANMTSQSQASAENDAWAAVTASKTANDAAASSFKLKLNINANTISDNGLLWALCKGTCPATALVTAFNPSAGNPAGSSPTATCATGGTVVACGVVPKLSTTTIELYNDTATFNTEAAASQTYNFYIWLDGDTIDDDNIGQGFDGYISAAASQQ